MNPFSQDNRVFGAAFGDTPFDYYVASTSEKSTLVKDMQDMLENYSFGEVDKKGVAFMSHEVLEEICKRFKTELTEEAEASTPEEPADWLSVYEDLAWAGTGINDANTTFLGVPLDTEDAALLHGVDRKFLYSFWRECFDNRQQLFLIFVRAEPTSVGGGGIGRVSSQLGGRAVALVWRDPAAPNTGTTRPMRSGVTMTQRNQTTCPPHRTRVLFYHQFD